MLKTPPRPSQEARTAKSTPCVRREPKLPVRRSTWVIMPLVRIIRSGNASMFASSCGIVIEPIVLSTAMLQ